MSYDFNVITVDPLTLSPIGACDHQISFERYVVNNEDFVTLNYLGNPAINFRAPINGANTVQMWISGEPVQQNDPTYGWSLVRDTNRVSFPGSNDIFYKVVFNRPVRIVRPLIEVSYITRQQYCMKCSGLGTLNDLKIAMSGSFLQVTQTVKLTQKALKWILTSLCSFYPSFTCTLKSYIGKKLGAQLTESDIQTSVINALTTMQQVQQAQATVQTLDPAEILQDIVNLTANVDPNDPTTVMVYATVSSANGTTAPLGFTVRMNS
jgi:hypothetical protein